MRIHLLAFFAFAQIAVLGAELLGTAYPLWIGEPVTLALEPVDPRSLFRGNYVALDYEISDLDPDLAAPGAHFARGDLVYVTLERRGAVHRATAVSHEPPDGGGPTLRGRVAGASAHYIEITYGIEAYFAPRERAEALERDYRRLGSTAGDDDGVRAYAIVMLAPNGRAALRDVVVARPAAEY
jgi:uncharacterized membrane-anchored protein